MIGLAGGRGSYNKGTHNPPAHCPSSRANRGFHPELMTRNRCKSPPGVHPSGLGAPHRQQAPLFLVRPQSQLVPPLVGHSCSSLALLVVGGLQSPPSPQKVASSPAAEGHDRPTRAGRGVNSYTFKLIGALYPAGASVPGPQASGSVLEGTFPPLRRPDVNRVQRVRIAALRPKRPTRPAPLSPCRGVRIVVLAPRSRHPHVTCYMQVMSSTATRSAVALTVLGLLQGAASFGLEATLTYDFRGEHFSLDPKSQWSTADLTAVDVAAAGSGNCETQGYDAVRFAQFPGHSAHSASLWQCRLRARVLKLTFSRRHLAVARASHAGRECLSHPRRRGPLHSTK